MLTEKGAGTAIGAYRDGHGDTDEHADMHIDRDGDRDRGLPTLNMILRSFFRPKRLITVSAFAFWSAVNDARAGATCSP